MGNNISGSLHCLLLSLAATASCRTPGSLSSDPKLIGGTAATATDIPYVVFIRSNGENVSDGCTATKIASKMFMTAAHCILDSENRGVRAGFTNLGDVKFTVDAARQVQFGDDITDSERFTIKNVFVHPQYVKSCQASADDHCGDAIGKNPWPPDVGIFETKEETPSIPVARINFAPIPYGTPVIVAGYGCEEGIFLPFGPSLRLKFGQTVTIPPSSLDSTASIDNFDDPTQLSKTVWITKGLIDQGVSLCSGDSGGPMFRADLNPIELAGINSSYNFLKDDDKGVAKTNWHTRVDKESRYDIDQWVAKVLNQQEAPTKVSAKRLILNDSPGVVYLTQNATKSEQSLVVSLPQTIEIVAQPSGAASVQITAKSPEAAPLDPVDGTRYKLVAGEYRIVSTLRGNTDLALLLRARSNPPLDFGVVRNDLLAGGSIANVSLANDNELTSFRLNISTDGQYRIKVEPPQKALVLFFSPDERSKPLYSETTEGDGLFKANFSAGDRLDLVLAPADGSGGWPQNFTVQFEGPL